MSWREALLRAIASPSELMGPDGKADALKLLLMRLCAIYVKDKRAVRIDDDDVDDNQTSSRSAAASRFDADSASVRVRAVDKVADFHFGNGAMLEAVHWRCAICARTRLGCAWPARLGAPVRGASACASASLVRRADEGERGLSQSLGMMASYRYLPASMRKRAAAYAHEGSVSIHTALWSLVHHPAFVR